MSRVQFGKSKQAVTLRGDIDRVGVNARRDADVIGESHRTMSYARTSPLQEIEMKKLIAALIVTMPFIAGTVYAQDKAPTAQQSKMGACSKQNKGLKGDEYKKAQKECLSKEADGRKPQQEKMKACAAENKGKKGAEYKAAQKECLSK